LENLLLSLSVMRLPRRGGAAPPRAAASHAVFLLLTTAFGGAHSKREKKKKEEDKVKEAPLNNKKKGGRERQLFIVFSFLAGTLLSSPHPTPFPSSLPHQKYLLNSTGVEKQTIREGGERRSSFLSFLLPLFSPTFEKTRK
jgi:hypothetical protein